MRLQSVRDFIQHRLRFGAQLVAGEIEIDAIDVRVPVHRDPKAEVFLPDVQCTGQ
jgi:hypothetical protein